MTDASAFTHTTAHGWVVVYRDLLAPSFIVNAEDRDSDDLRVAAITFSTLGRIDVEAARDHHVVGVVEHATVAVGIEATDVAGLHLKHNPSGWDQPDGLCPV